LNIDFSVSNFESFEMIVFALAGHANYPVHNYNPWQCPHGSTCQQNLYLSLFPSPSPSSLPAHGKKGYDTRSDFFMKAFHLK
jgi:hypothetical protein